MRRLGVSWKQEILIGMAEVPDVKPHEYYREMLLTFPDEASNTK